MLKQPKLDNKKAIHTKSPRSINGSSVWIAFIEINEGYAAQTAAPRSLHQQLHCLGLDDRLDAVMHIQLAIQMLEVHLDCALGDRQSVGDLVVRKARRQ